MYEKGIEKWTPSRQLSNTPASPATNPPTRQQANKPTRQHSNRTTSKKTNPEGQIHTVQIRMENGGQIRFITFLSGCKNVRKRNQKIGFHLPTRAARQPFQFLKRFNSRISPTCQTPTSPIFPYSKPFAIRHLNLDRHIMKAKEWEMNSCNISVPAASCEKNTDECNGTELAVPLLRQGEEVVR